MLNYIPSLHIIHWLPSIALPLFLKATKYAATLIVQTKQIWSREIKETSSSSCIFFLHIMSTNLRWRPNSSKNLLHCLWFQKQQNMQYVNCSDRYDPREWKKHPHILAFFLAYIEHQSEIKIKQIFKHMLRNGFRSMRT